MASPVGQKTPLGAKPGFSDYLKMLYAYGNPNSAADQIMQGFPSQLWNAASLGGGLSGGKETAGVWSMNPRALMRTAGKPGPLGGTR